MKDECTVEVPVPNSTMEVLGEAECRALLANESVGRLAYISENAPMIAPVDFMMFDELIVFRSDPGDKLSHVPLQQVCFEADGSDGIDRVWSVVVHGHARDVTTALNEQYEQIRQRQLPTFATLADPHWVAIEVDQISGRRLAR